MTHHDAFLADILAHPDDDTPRLVYADWLDEHGEPERAEFIRVQCELAARYPRPENEGGGTHVDAQGAALRRRETRLLTPERRHDWFLPKMPRGWEWWGWEFRRGFVAEISCSAADFLRRRRQIFAAAPVRRVTLTTAPDIRVERRGPREEPSPDDPFRKLVLDVYLSWGDLKPLHYRNERPLPATCAAGDVRGELFAEVENFLKLPGLLSREGGWFPGVAFAVAEQARVVDFPPDLGGLGRLYTPQIPRPPGAGEVTLTATPHFPPQGDVRLVLELTGADGSLTLAQHVFVPAPGEIRPLALRHRFAGVTDSVRGGVEYAGPGAIPFGTALSFAP